MQARSGNHPESHDGVHIDPQQYADAVDERTLAITSWFATRDQFDFNSRDFRYHDDARDLGKADAGAPG